MLLLAADLQKFDLYHLQQLCKKDSLNSGLKSFKNYIEQKKSLTLQTILKIWFLSNFNSCHVIFFLLDSARGLGGFIRVFTCGNPEHSVSGVTMCYGADLEKVGGLFSNDVLIFCLETAFR
jgi:hypothetical protein